MRTPHDMLEQHPAGAIARLLEAVAGVFIAAHGVVHLIGVTLLWKLGEPGNFRYEDMIPTPGTAAAYVAGVLWLVAAIAFTASGVSIAMKRQAWIASAVIALLFSVPALALNPSRNVAGLVVDGLVLAGCVAVFFVRRRTA